MSHSRHSNRRRQDWEVRGGGVFSSSWKTQTLNISRCHCNFPSFCHCVLYRKREIHETLVVFLFWFPSADKRPVGQHRHGSTCMISAFHTTPPHPMQQHRQSQWTGSGQQQISLLALSKGLIAASLYLHTNKREDVDSYYCLPPLRVVIYQFSPLWECQIRKATTVCACQSLRASILPLRQKKPRLCCVCCFTVISRFTACSSHCCLCLSPTRRDDCPRNLQ